MTHTEERIKKRIKNGISPALERSQLDQSTIDEIIDECISVEEFYPFYNISVNQFGATSTKPTNIEVEFDIPTALGILSQLGDFSDGMDIFALIGVFCAIVSQKMRIDLEPETGFVYWVAYENQKDPWEIPKEDLIRLSVDQSESLDVRFELTEEEVEYRIRRLCRINSFKIEYRRNNEIVVLRERCSADWSL